MSAGKKIDIEKLRLTDFDLWKMQQAEKARLEVMTPEQREAYHEAQEADGLREALSDEVWGKA